MSIDLTKNFSRFKPYKTAEKIKSINFGPLYGEALYRV